MKTVREEIAWLIVERMNDSVGFDEAIEQVDDYLAIVIKRIDEIIQECKDKEKQYPIAVNYRIQPLLEIKEMLK